MLSIATVTTADEVDAAVCGGCAVVIDVLRASSTITTALANGAIGVIPVAAPEEAFAVADRIGRGAVLLGGERGAVAIPGFDLGNSPASYTADAVRGKTIVFTTTNGTRALRSVERFATADPASGAATTATTIVCGALLNAGAVARFATRDPTTRTRMTLVCAGSDGRFSFEDFLCAGAIIAARLRAAGADPAGGEVPEPVALDDASRAAVALFEQIAQSPAGLRDAVASGAHARHLIALGFGADVAECAALDRFGLVPRYAKGVILRDAER